MDPEDRPFADGCTAALRPRGALVNIGIPAEPMSANGLRLGERLIYPAAFPLTRARLEARGLGLRLVEVDELAKAEGAVTCCSLVLREAGGVGPALRPAR